MIYIDQDLSAMNHKTIAIIIIPYHLKFFLFVNMLEGSSRFDDVLIFLISKACPMNPKVRRAIEIMASIKSIDTREALW